MVIPDQTARQPDKQIEGLSISQSVSLSLSKTHIPSFVTILYVPLGWKPPSMFPSASTWMLPKMSSGLVLCDGSNESQRY